MSRRLWWRNPASAVGALVVAAATLSACGNGSATSAHIPAGWTTHTYEGIAISAPAGWKYYGPNTEINCPYPQNGGFLVIGATYSGAPCPAGVEPSTTIQIEAFGPGAASTHGIRVNGLNVKVVDGAAGIVWFVPSGNLTVSGEGPEANQVLHTLGPS